MVCVKWFWESEIPKISVASPKSSISNLLLIKVLNEDSDVGVPAIVMSSTCTWKKQRLFRSRLINRQVSAVEDLNLIDSINECISLYQHLGDCFKPYMDFLTFKAVQSVQFLTSKP